MTRFRKLTQRLSREPYAYCNECGRRLNFSEDAVWVYPISIYGEFSSRYTEPVCDSCIDKYYVACVKCGYYYNRACCAKTDNGWICDVCRGENYAPMWGIVFAEER